MMIIATTDSSSAALRCVHDLPSPKATPTGASLVTYVRPKRKSRFTIRMRPGQKAPAALASSGWTVVSTPRISRDNYNAGDNPGPTSTLKETTLPGDPSAVSCNCRGIIPAPAPAPPTPPLPYLYTSTDTFAEKYTIPQENGGGVEPQCLEADESLCYGKQGLDSCRYSSAFRNYDVNSIISARIRCQRAKANTLPQTEMFMPLHLRVWRQHKIGLVSVLLLLTLLAVSSIVITVVVSGARGTG